MGRLDDKVVLITGGSRGQGAAEATLFASEGAAVVITDVLDEEGSETAAATGAHYLHHDVRDEAAWADVVERTIELHGHIDVLINNAGIFRPKPLLEISFEEYRMTIEVNQYGTFLGMQAVAPSMVEAGSGSIVNISSIAGLRSSYGIAYGASKWAIRGMTKSAARELGPSGIRVNSIHPGAIDTPMVRDVPPAPGRRLWAPLKRVGQPEEVAQLALFLASDESSYCTGSEFVIDGGVMA